MGRPLLLALFGIIAVMVVSWMLGELLRQRRGRREALRRPSDHILSRSSRPITGFHGRSSYCATPC